MDFPVAGEEGTATLLVILLDTCIGSREWGVLVLHQNPPASRIQILDPLVVPLESTETSKPQEDVS